MTTKTEKQEDFDFDTAGFLVTDTLIPKTIEVDGKTRTVYVKRISAAEALKFHERQSSENIDDRLNAHRDLLVLTVRKADGSPHLTPEKAAKLDMEPYTELMRVVGEVMTGGKDGGNV